MDWLYEIQVVGSLVGSLVGSEVVGLGLGGSEGGHEIFVLINKETVDQKSDDVGLREDSLEL